MSNSQELAGEVEDEIEDTWFYDARVVDQEWVEIDVVTPKGEKVLYCVPRRTLFQAIDA